MMICIIKEQVVSAERRIWSRIAPPAVRWWPQSHGFVGLFVPRALENSTLAWAAKQKTRRYNNACIISSVIKGGAVGRRRFRSVKVTSYLPTFG